MIKPKKEEMKKKAPLSFWEEFRETSREPRTTGIGGELFLIPSPKSSSKVS